MDQNLQQSCKNCNAPFQGKFCNECGEKVVEQRDFKLKSILNNALGAIFSLDSKFLKTLKALFFKPGKLSHDYILGLRKPYMKPFQVFVFSNILFFIFLNDIDIFRTPSVWYFQEEFDGVFVLDHVRAICTERGVSIEEIAVAYDNLSGALAKGFLFLLTPLIGLLLLLLNIRKSVFYGQHVILAVHMLSFFLIFSACWTELVALVITKISRWYMIIPVMICITLWMILAMKRFYNDKWYVAIFKGLIGIIIFSALIQFYRASVSVISLNLV